MHPWPAPASRPDQSSRSSQHITTSPGTPPATGAASSHRGAVPDPPRRPEVLLLMPQSLERITRTDAGGAVVTLRNRSAILIHPSVLRCVNSIVYGKEAQADAVTNEPQGSSARVPARSDWPAFLSWKHLAWWPMPLVTITLFLILIALGWGAASLALMAGR